jgi:type I restriction-modification system DNA methylase subunit
MPCPPQVAKLIEKFDLHRDSYHSAGYKEAQLRQEFIDPLFAALGWDMDNSAGKAEAYKDVIHEDAIKLGGGHKAPDYCFRIGGIRKFFVEAKKPAVDIKHEIDPAYQLRRYAWSAKLPLSILTDFDEIAVYDSRIRPSKDDKPSAARVLLLRYADLADRWDELAGIFSKNAIEKGSFDKFAESNKKKRGTAEVDAAFLAEIEGWRLELAKNLALRNPKLDQRDLNFAVQRIIDRLIFLRIAEDRGIEDYARLQSLLNMPGVYRKLGELFRTADDRYNSGLFHFEPEKGRLEPPDKLTLDLEIDDKVLKEIIRHLYYPDSPYEFSVLSADILGQVYEQFLGKVIKLSAGHRAAVEEKPEVRKAGGVYYTPTYIVDYIVQQTVGKLLEGKTPKQAAKLKILDPACGSGSFLIGAYQYLLDWHRDWYLANGSEKHSKEVYQDRSGQWRLILGERKRILLNNIYGVDIDHQAVEVTKLSLCLKVLENANRAALEQQLKIFHKDRALPDLGGNIKCGNSLIGPDFYNGNQMNLFDDEERYRINVFDWSGPDGFSDIMKSGGFDAVIGNPPYIRMETFKALKEYLREKYATHDERSDMYAYFIEREHKLLRHAGKFGMIVSNKFLRSNYGRPLRQFLRREGTVERVVDFAGLPVFAGATVRTIVLLTSRRNGTPANMEYSPPLDLDSFEAVSSGRMSVDQAIKERSYQVSPPSIEGEAWGFANQEVATLLEKLKTNGQRLFDYCGGRICMGVKSGLTEAFVIDKLTRDRIVKRNKKSAEIIKPFVNGRDVRRYQLIPPGDFLIYTYHGVPIERYPQVEEHLRPYKAKLRARATKQEWYELQQPQLKFSTYLDGPKIIFPDISTEPRFALDEEGHYGSNTVYFIPGKDLFLLALLNSKVGNFYFVQTCAGLEGKNEIYLRFFGQYLEGFPVAAGDSSEKNPSEKRSQVEKLVDQILTLHTKLAATKPGHAHTVIERQIEATDRQIDQLVYQLYALTDSEIQLVESAAT